MGYDWVPLTFTEVMNHKLIGQGRAQKLVGQSLVRFTVNANGVLTAAIDKFVVHCPGLSAGGYAKPVSCDGT